MEKCRCGKSVIELHSYFDKASKYRITCCDQCAEDNKLTDESKFEKIPYKEIKQERKFLDDSGRMRIETIINESLNITPQPNAI